MTAEPKTCYSCRMEHPTGVGFKRVRGRMLCGMCATRRKHHKAERSGVILWILFIATALAWVMDGPSVLKSMLTVISLIWIVQVVIVILHELGHAVAALLLGVRVRGIEFGREGPVILSLNMGDVAIKLRLLPLDGVTILEPAQRAVRVRHIVISAAGALTTIGLTAAAVMWEPTGWVADRIRYDAIFFGSLSILFNLVVPLHKHGNDASNIWKLMTMADEEIDSLSGMSAHDEMARRIGSHVTGDAMSDQELQATREFFLERLEHPGLMEEGRALESNNLAAVDVIIGDSELLEEADRLSRFAYEHLPLPEIMSTRGSVLVAMGEYSEGLKLLEQSLIGLRSDHRDATRASIAVAQLHLGDVFAARASMAQMASEPNLPASKEARRLLGPAEMRNVVANYWVPERSPEEAARLLVKDAGAIVEHIRLGIVEYLGRVTDVELSELLASEVEASARPTVDWARQFASALTIPPIRQPRSD